MSAKYYLAGVGVVCITGVSALGIYLGHNGTLLATTLSAISAIIAGTIGYEIGKTKTT